MQEKAIYEFDRYRLDLGQRVLLRDGELIPLAPKAFDLLLALVETEGRVVGKEELLKRVWPDAFVEEGSLSQNISILRKTLGENGGGPQYIQTIAKRGYRFLAALKPIPEGNQQAVEDRAPLRQSVRRRRWALMSGVAAVLVTVAVVVSVGIGRKPAARLIRSVAVLPLENLSHDPDQEYFADGMTDALITDLAKVSALRVISRTSVMQYKGAKRPVSQIARELNVDALLEGTVMRDQDEVRITAQLISAEPEKHLWAEKYEAQLSGILGLQDKVAESVAHAIQIQLTGRERSLVAAHRAVDPAAYDFYLKGRYLWEQSGEKNLVESRQYLEQAVAADPGYALAWAGLADTYNALADWGVDASEVVRPQARAAAERALDLDRSLVEPLVTLAEVKMDHEWDWAGAERLCKQVITLAPNYGSAHTVYATLLAEIGRTAEAVTEARRAREVEPLGPREKANVVWKLYLARQYDEAELDSQKYRVFTGYVQASVRLKIGRTSDAIADLRRAAAEWGRGALVLMFLAHGLGVTGERVEAQQMLQELQKRKYTPPEYLAIVYEGLGEREQALESFEKAFSERSMNGWFIPDPRLDGIRKEPRFQAILKKMGLPQQASFDPLSQ